MSNCGVAWGLYSSIAIPRSFLIHRATSYRCYNSPGGWLPAQQHRLTASQQMQFIPCLLRIQFRQYFALYKLAREGDAFALRELLKVEKNQE